MNELDGLVQSPTHDAIGFDTDQKLSHENALQFFKAGYRFCVRYLSRGSESAHDLTRDEADGILRAGLALMAVQHVARGWLPSEHLGLLHGSAAASNAKRVGFPSGVNVWCDLEGIGFSIDPEATMAYCSNWYRTVKGAGFVPGLYVGASCALTTQQLYALPFQHYWQSESEVPTPARRGYQLIQLRESMLINGLPIDQDITRPDTFGGQVLWLAPDSP
jgi:hypothetical protein